MPPEPTLATIAVCSIICLMSATLVGFSGFGFALIAVPLMTLILDLKFAVPLVLVVAFFSVVVLSVNKLRFFREPTVVTIFIGMVTGIIIGTNILANFEASILKRILGVMFLIGLSLA